MTTNEVTRKPQGPYQRRRADTPIRTPKPRKSARMAPRCASCRGPVMPHDQTALDGKRYCRNCWPNVPAWMRGTVPMRDDHTITGTLLPAARRDRRRAQHHHYLSGRQLSHRPVWAAVPRANRDPLQRQ
jgi:hypothetical protein